MEVILIEDMENLGRRGTVAKVADGYARNYLIPKRIAIIATPGNLKVIENQKLVWAKQEAKLKDEADLLSRALGEVCISVEKRAGEGDALYGSVTSMEIADHLQSLGFNIDRRKIRMDHPVKTLGEFSIPIRLHHDVTASVKLVVRKEGAEQAAAVAAPAVEATGQE